MPRKRVSIRKIHDVLRLHFGLRLPQRQIARSVRLSQSTIHDYIARFEKSGLEWPLPDDCDESGLQRALFGDARKSAAAPAARPLPDFAEVSRELTANRHTSLQLLWEEYRDRNPESHYSYSSFWRRYDQWRLGQDVVMRQQHRPGERLFVDWAGAKIPVYDPETGEVCVRYSGMAHFDTPIWSTPVRIPPRNATLVLAAGAVTPSIEKPAEFDRNLQRNSALAVHEHDASVFPIAFTLCPDNRSAPGTTRSTSKPSSSPGGISPAAL